MQTDPLQSEHCAEKLKALAEPMRLRIVQALRGGPLSVGEVADRIDVEIVLVSHHLGVLFHAALVERTRQGRFVIYRLRDDVFDPQANEQGKEHIDLGCCRIELPIPEKKTRK